MLIQRKARELKTLFGLRIQDLTEDFDTRVFPHLPFPVLIKGKSSYELKEMNYSLIPKWSKVRRPKFATYNARIETLTEKPTWKSALREKHCVVPIDAFYESCYEGSHAGSIVKFSSKGDQPLAVAGLWEEWIDLKTGEVVPSFAVITTSPSEFIQSVGHDRCPLFLKSKAIKDWLSPVKRNPDDCVKYLIENFEEPDFTVEIDRPLKAGWEKRK